MVLKSIEEIFPRKCDRRNFMRFRRIRGLYFNEVQQIVAYIRYYGGERENKYRGKGEGRRTIAKRTGIPEYRVQLILEKLTYPDGDLPKTKSKYDI